MERNSKFWAFIGILLGVVGFILVLSFQRKDHYALHYAKQGLVLNLFVIVILVVNKVPFLGGLISLIGSVIAVIWFITGLIYAVSGEKKEIPIVGELTRKIKV